MKKITAVNMAAVFFGVSLTAYGSDAEDMVNEKSISKAAGGIVGGQPVCIGTGHGYLPE